MSENLTMWVIYDHPHDYPDHFVARPWHFSRGIAPATADVMLEADLDVLRRRFEQRGLYRIARHPEDDPVIVETWL